MTRGATRQPASHREPLRVRRCSSGWRRSRRRQWMTYIVQRKDRFYVVAYDGLDPLTGKERRRWHPVGHDRARGRSVAARIDRDDAGAAAARGGPVHLGEFLTGTWLPCKRRHVRATTAYRYSWFVDRYVNPAIGDVPLRRLRADHLDGLYEPARHDRRPSRHGSRTQDRPRGSHDRARRTRPRRAPPARRPQRRPRRPRPTPPPVRTRAAARSGPPQELRAFLNAARPTGSTRLCTSPPTPACAAARSSGSSGPTSIAPRSGCRSPGPCRTSAAVPSSSASRPAPVDAPSTRRQHNVDARPVAPDALSRDGLPHGARRLDVLQPTGRFLNPESVSQLFDRIVRRRAPPHPVPRLAAHPRLAARRRRRADQGRERTARPRPPAFTMHTYQHLLPGMSAAAAEQFATLVAAADR